MKETSRLIANRILSILTGVIAGMIVITLGTYISNGIFPLPEGITPSDREGFIKHISNLPLSAFILVLTSHGIASLVAGFVASKMAKVEKRGAAVFAGLILLLAGVLNLISIPHPLWFSIADVLLYTPMAILGYTLMKQIFNKK